MTHIFIHAQKVDAVQPHYILKAALGEPLYVVTFNVIHEPGFFRRLFGAKARTEVVRYTGNYGWWWDLDTHKLAAQLVAEQCELAVKRLR